MMRFATVITLLSISSVSASSGYASSIRMGNNDNDAIISNLVSKIRAQDAEQKATLVKIDNLSANVQAQEASISQLALLLDQQARLLEKNFSHRGLRGGSRSYEYMMGWNKEKGIV